VTVVILEDAAEDMESGRPNSWVTVTNFTLTAPVQLWIDTNVSASLAGTPGQFYLVLPAP
jgi:hypothetical protein